MPKSKIPFAGRRPLLLLVRSRTILAAAPLALLLAACAPPPDELYDRGQRLEMEGRYAEAVDHYVRVLEREPTMRKAQGRLHVAGGILLERLLVAGATAPPPEAADAYLDAAALQARTAAVGIPLDAPPSFEDDLAVALDVAVEHLIAEGADALDAGRYDAALAAFGRAGRYRPSAEQADALRAFTYDAHLAWADAERAAGRFRASYDRAEAARPFAGGDRTLDEIAAFQADVLDAGSVYAALFPVEVEPGRTPSGVPPDFAVELDLLLADEYWRRPPPFVRVVDPAEVRGLLRRRYDPAGRRTDLRLTAGLTRDLLASFGVASALTDYGREAEEADRDTLEAPLRRGDGTGHYVRVRDHVTLDAALAFAVVDAERARVRCEGTVTADARGDVWYGEEAGRGDVRLPREHRALFDDVAIREAERRIEAALQERLAERLAGRVYDCLLRQVR